MANELSLEFDCPQYVDFSTELNSSSKDDVFFDCKDHHTTENETPCARKPPIKKQYPDKVVEKTEIGLTEKITPCATKPPIKKQYPDKVVEKTEIGLTEKMTPALSVIGNTPKLKKTAVKKKHLVETFSHNLCLDSVKPALEANTVPDIGLRRSKSIARLNKILTENQNTLKGLRKRSSSLNDMRIQKKQTYPMTPMCLKRTIMKSKGRVIKTTEEMELEEIAKLQKQLIQHLRYNEKTLMRLKLKPRPGIASKNAHTKPENFKGTKGLNPFLDKQSVSEKETRRNIHTVTAATVKNEAVKIENIIKCQAAVQTDKGLKGDKKSKQPTISVASDREVIQSAKRTGSTKKIGFHSGLIFHENVKKSTVVQPFSFETKIREKTMSSGTKEKAGINLSSSMLNSNMVDGKENIPCDKQISTLRKAKGTHNTKCDIVKQIAINKKILDKHVRNPVKGFPLSENFSRK